MLDQKTSRLACCILPWFIALSLQAIGAGDMPAFSLPTDLTQYLIKERGHFVAVPVADAEVGGTTVVVVETPARVEQIKKFHKVRAAYGGQYPYVLVKSRKPYLIVSQEDDILVVGLPEPKRLIVERASWFRLDHFAQDLPIGRRLTKPPVDITYVQDRIDIRVVLPPGLPDDVLMKQDLFGPKSGREATYEVNRKRAFLLGGQEKYRTIRDSHGRRYDVYRVILE